jgi:hypothetical protein
MAAQVPELLHALRLIESKIPERFQVDIRAHIAATFYEGEAALPRWSTAIERLLTLGQFDALFDLLGWLVTTYPSETFFRLALGEIAQSIGKPEVCIKCLRGVRGNPRLDTEIDWLLATCDPANKDMAAQETLLMGMSDWNDQYQLSFIRSLVQIGEIDRARSFFHRWAQTHAASPAAFKGLAEASLLLGDPVIADRIYRQFGYAELNASADHVLGEFPDQIPAYGPTHEADIVSKIEAAFAADLNTPHNSLLGIAPESKSVKVALISYDRGNDMPSDMAEHLTGSAKAAGIELHCYLDAAIIVPYRFNGTDVEISERLEALDAFLGSVRPDIVILDYCAITNRSLDPWRLELLRTKHGFRLVAMFRDAHEHMRVSVEALLPVADTIISFDDENVGLGNAVDRLRDRILALPVPSLHGPFLETYTKHHALVFAGAINYTPRVALLARLLCEPINFRATFGAKRMKDTPDTASYARFLGSGRGVLNFSRHAGGLHLMTGRIWETLALRSVLIEQDNPITRRFLVPYRHYLPWRNLTDIAHYALFLERRWDLGARIAQEGHDWAQRHYGNSGFWSKIISHALRPLDNDQLELRRHASRYSPLIVDPALLDRWQFLFEISSS